MAGASGEADSRSRREAAADRLWLDGGAGGERGKANAEAEADRGAVAGESAARRGTAAGEATGRLGTVAETCRCTADIVKKSCGYGYGVAPPCAHRDRAEGVHEPLRIVRCLRIIHIFSAKSSQHLYGE